MEIKLIVCCHRSAPVADGGIFLGRDYFCPERIPDIFGCDANRSVLLPVYGNLLPTEEFVRNDRYNELSAAYWAWKNLSADWYGLMQYRRFFAFSSSEKPVIVDKDGTYPCDFSQLTLEKICSSCDFVAPLPLKKGNLSRQYAESHNADDLLLAERILCRLYPDYTEVCRTYLNGESGFFYNMFLFPHSIFDRYCHWIFDILGEYEKSTSGRMYVSERLTGIFIAKLLAEGKRAAFFPTVFRPERNFSLALRHSLHAFRQEKRLRAFKPLFCKIFPASWTEKCISK